VNTDRHCIQSLIAVTVSCKYRHSSQHSFRYYISFIRKQ